MDILRLNIPNKMKETFLGKSGFSLTEAQTEMKQLNSKCTDSFNFFKRQKARPDPALRITSRFKELWSYI